MPADPVCQRRLGSQRLVCRGRLSAPPRAWLLGVASAVKRKVADDPVFLDRVENALEWDFSLALTLAFVALSPLLRDVSEASQQPCGLQ